MDKSRENFQKAADILKITVPANPTEKKMYVYFDDSGNIKCISPVEDVDHESKFQVTQLPLKNVYGFITGEISPAKFIVKKRKGKVNEFVIVERQFEVSHVRQLDRFLTEIDVGFIKDSELEVVVDEANASLTFRLSHAIRQEFIESVDNLENASINGLRTLKFYCTTKNDPSIFIEGFDVPVVGLLQGNVIVPYKSNISQYSLFTRRVFTKYSYIILKGDE